MVAASPPADSNGDGVVSRAEYSRAANAQFDQADTNSDGVWTGDEARSFQKNRRADNIDRVQSEEKVPPVRKSPRHNLDLSSLSPERRAEIQARLDKMQAKTEAAERRKVKRIERQQERLARVKARKNERRERRAARAQSGDFVYIDTNEGGHIHQDKRRAAIENVRKNRQTKIDPDLTGTQRRQLGGIDVDGDGNISQAELNAAREQYRKTGRADLGRKSFDRSHVLERMDRNADGQISRTEFIALNDERFDNFDRDGDGQLSSEEQMPTRKRLERRIRQQRQQPR